MKSLQRDPRGLVNYQQLVSKLENPKQNFPSKAVGIRLSVFLQQNGLTGKDLIEKLLESKRTSKTNQESGKHESAQISTSYFAKFIKAKVDKKRSFEEIKAIVVEVVDMDRDGIISISDLEGFLGRINYHAFF